MNRKWLFVVGLLLPALVFTSCDSFFSEALLGSPREYDPGKINLTAENLAEWQEASIGNPALAAAVAAKIKELVAAMVTSNPSDPETAKFQEAGVQQAIEASGIGVSILAHAGQALSELVDEKNLDEGAKDKVIEILEDIREDFKAAGPQAAEDITNIVKDNVTTTGGSGLPEFTGAYKDTAKPGDVGQAVLVLALSIFGADDEEDFETMINEIGEGKEVHGISVDTSTGEVQISNDAEGDTVKVLAAYLNLIASDTTGKFDDNPITSAIKDAFNLNT